jgi:lysophospholipase L1-like esterase
MTHAPAAPPQRRRRWIGVATATMSTLLLALLAEGVFRVIEPRIAASPTWAADARAYLVEGAIRGYAPHPHTVYRRSPSMDGVNSRGFFDTEWPLERTPGVPRILCLGGSTTEGGNDRGHAGSYPYQLREILGQSLGGPVEVFNAGISSWTSAEILAAWTLELQDLCPDLVIMHEAVNDSEPRNWPGFKSDYSHYRHEWRPPRLSAPSRWLAERSDFYAWLILDGQSPTLDDLTTHPRRGKLGFDQGRFPPGSELPYRRNLTSLLLGARQVGADFVFATLPFDLRFEDRGERSMAHFWAGILEHNQIMRELAREHGALLVDLEAESRRARELLEPHFIDMVHVDPEGNRLKALRIAQCLLAPGSPVSLATSSPSGARSGSAAGTGE